MITKLRRSLAHLFLVAPVFSDVGSVAQDSPQLPDTHQPTVEIIKHKMPPEFRFLRRSG